MGKQVVQKLIRINHFEHIDLTEFWQYVEQKWRDRDPLVMKKKRSLYVQCQLQEHTRVTYWVYWYLTRMKKRKR